MLRVPIPAAAIDIDDIIPMLKSPAGRLFAVCGQICGQRGYGAERKSRFCAVIAPACGIFGNMQGNNPQKSRVGSVALAVANIRTAKSRGIVVSA